MQPAFVEMQEQADAAHERQPRHEPEARPPPDRAAAIERLGQADRDRDQRQELVLEDLGIAEALPKPEWSPRPRLRIAADEEVHAEGDPERRARRGPRAAAITNRKTPDERWLNSE